MSPVACTAHSWLELPEHGQMPTSANSVAFWPVMSRHNDPSVGLAAAIVPCCAGSDHSWVPSPGEHGLQRTGPDGVFALLGAVRQSDGLILGEMVARPLDFGVTASGVEEEHAAMAAIWPLVCGAPQVFGPTLTLSASPTELRLVAPVSSSTVSVLALPSAFRMSNGTG